MCNNHKPIVGPHNHPLSLDSGNSVKQFLRAAAKDFGRTAIAITDHGTMGAIIEAHDYVKELKKKENIDITVIPGVELYLIPAPDDDAGFQYYHVTVHFDDFESYLEGCKLSKTGFDRSINKGGELKPLATWEELESLSGKITLFSSCLVGAVIRPWLNNKKEVSERNFVRLMNIAGPGRFFAEIFPYEVSKNWSSKTKTFENIKPSECSATGQLQIDANKWVIGLSQKYNVPMVISEDAHYAHESDKFIQDARLNKDGKSSWKMSDANCLHTNEWLYKEFRRIHPEFMTEKVFDEMVDNSYAFLNNFKGFNPKFKPALPKVYVTRIDSQGQPFQDEPKNDDDLTAWTLQLAVKKARIDFSNPVYTARLNKEIHQLAYNGKVNILPYMLTLNTIVDFCEANDILIGPGRGSAAGCLLAYALGITSVDPIKEDLSFERFFDVTRVEEGLADIDTDFSNREAVVNFIKDHWGDKFAFLGIGTTFKTKSALKDIDRFLNGEVRKETEDVCKSIGKNPLGVEEEKFLRGHTDADGIPHIGELENNEKLRTFLENNPKIEENLFKMVGIVRQMGRHAAGVLIADRPVHSFIPIMKVSDEPTTQLLPKWVEKCGGVKYDILGVSTLEDIRLALKFIKERTGKVIDPWKIEDSNDFWEACANEPSGIFQLHTPTVRVGLQTMRPKSVQQAAILTSVFRPGAMDAKSDEDPNKNMSDIFLERWTGKRKVNYVHPELEPILGPTVGIIVYQEQIMRIVHELGGLTMPETNKLRKAISKKAGDDLMNMLMKVKMNLVARGWTDQQAQTTVDQMKASGRYCFNKSHAVSYCYIARACAYLKYFYPMEWWTAVLSNASKEDLQEYWQRVNGSIIQPDINTSTTLFQIVERNDKQMILSPLNLVEGVGTAVMAEIMKSRPFTSLEDMMTRMDRRIVNKGPMIKLIISGTLDRFFEPGAKDYEKIQMYLNKKASIEGKKSPETVPMEYVETTPLKNFLLKKSVFKVYTDNVKELALPKLLSQGRAMKVGQTSAYMFNSNPRRSIISLKMLEKLMEDREIHKVAVIGYVVDTETKLFQNNTKSRLIAKVEIENKVFDFIKWPSWGNTHHGVDDDITESVCVFLLSRWKRDGDFFIDDIYVLENLDFLKEKDNATKKPRKPKNGTDAAIGTVVEGS